MRIPKITLGRRLALARDDAGFTQEEMAERLGVSHSTVAKWEADRGQPRDFMDRMHEWSELTNVPIWWLLEYEPNKTRTPRRRGAPRRGRSGESRPGGYGRAYPNSSAA